MKFREFLTAGCLAFWMSLGSVPSNACEMPEALILKQTLLNMKYPDALFVNGATWRMQQAGRLEMPDRARLMATGAQFDKLEREALADMKAALASLGEALHSASRQSHEVSLVLVERMHWERFLPAPNTPYDSYQTRCFFPCNIETERAEDLVLVTSEPALRAIRDGVLPLSQAVDLGLLRLYGEEGQEASFLKDFSDIGEQPLRPRGPVGSARHQPLFLTPDPLGQ